MPGSSGKIQMQPGNVRRYEAAQESRGENVVPLAVSVTLQNVRDAAFEIRVEVHVHGETPDALTAARARGFNFRAQFRAIRERAAVAFRERVHARTRERGVVDDGA